MLTSLRLCRIMLCLAARIFAVGTYIAFAVAVCVICAQAVQGRAEPKRPGIVDKQVEDPVTTGSSRRPDLDRAALKKLIR